MNNYNQIADWRDDLDHSRDLNNNEKESIGFLLNWFESWRLASSLMPNRDSAARFWRETVLSKERESWQLDHWTEAIRWYLAWLELCKSKGVKPISLSERMMQAVDKVGSRRGLAWRTRKTYGGWIARFGATVKTPQEAKDPTRAKEWLAKLVSETKVSFSTQKQALNALVFFYKDVCGIKELDLGVKMRKRPSRIPVVLSKGEVMRLIEKLEPKATSGNQR
ncbi:MAG: site-specific integrase [Akkermansiaceae bacterium]